LDEKTTKIQVFKEKCYDVSKGGKNLRVYVYDVKTEHSSDPRRVKFFKELFGYAYTWKNKEGKTLKGQKLGLVDIYGCDRAGDSAILVRDEHAEVFNAFFKKYKDIVRCRVFLIVGEESI